MPCASSVLSDSRPRNGSFTSDRQIAIPDAFMVACCGTPSNTSSNPSAAGALSAPLHRSPGQRHGAIEQEFQIGCALASLVEDPA